MDIESMQKRNFTAFLIHALFLALTLNFIDTNTVVPNMLAQAGGTALHMGILSAIMIGGTRFMQLVFAGMIVPLGRKKPALLAGIYIRVAALLLLGYFIGNLSGVSTLKVWTIIFVMTVFSFSGAFANIAYTDILGRVVAPTRRKKLLVAKQLISSIGVILSALAVKYVLSRLAFPANYSLLFLLGGVLLLLGTIGFWMIWEPAQTATPKIPLRTQMRRFVEVLRKDRNFRLYLVLINTTGTVISTLPFLILYGQTRFTVDGSLTGTFLLVQMAGALATNLVLSFFSKHKGYRSLIYLFVVSSAAAPLAALLLPPDPAWYAAVFLFGGIAHTLSQIISTGVLLEISSDGNRALYTGLSGAGSIMQVLYPMVFGLLVPLFGYTALLGMTVLYLLLGMVAARKIKCESLEMDA